MAVEAQLAPIGGPIGVVGVAAEVALIPQLSLTAGAGLGIASPQFAVTIRPRLPVTPQAALELSAGYSHGSYTHVLQFGIGGPGVKESFVGGSWLNADAGVQARFDSGVTLRFFVGMSKLVACDKAELNSGGERTALPQGRWPLLPYGGVAVGYAFGIW